MQNAVLWGHASSAGLTAEALQGWAGAGKGSEQSCVLCDGENQQQQAAEPLNYTDASSWPWSNTGFFPSEFPGIGSRFSLPWVFILYPMTSCLHLHPHLFPPLLIDGVEAEYGHGNEQQGYWDRGHEYLQREDDRGVVCAVTGSVTCKM